MSEKFSENQISSWVSASLDNEDIKNYKVELDGFSEKGEGYATDIVFVKVIGNKKSNEEDVELNLVLKVGKDFPIVSTEQMASVYMKEMFLYDRIFPEYREFEESKQLKNIFKSIPNCLKTLNVERQILVFENLRKQGYVEHNRQVPMNIAHMKIVLQNYAKFHSIGFAFKDQKPSEFGNLVANFPSGYKVMLDSKFRTMFQIKVTASRNYIAEVDEILAKRIDVLLESDLGDILDEVLNNKVVEESVITHGDCWNSNFLFKYETGNHECPTSVAILDWQLSSFICPLVDLSYFMFAVSSKDQVSKFDELLEYYYEILSKNILELGSDPRKLFPRSKFLEYWKYYSVVGYIFTMTFVDMAMCEKSDVPDVDNIKDEKEFLNLSSKTLNMTAKNKEIFLERLLSISRYYLDLTGK